jgi:hypothetical protein
MSKLEFLSLVWKREENFCGDKKGFIIFSSSIEVKIIEFCTYSAFLNFPILSSRMAFFSKACANSKSYSLALCSGNSSVSLGKNLSLLRVSQYSLALHWLSRSMVLAYPIFTRRTASSP